MNDPWAALQADMRACRLCLEAGYQIAPGAVFSGPAPAALGVLAWDDGPGCDTVAEGLTPRRLPPLPAMSAFTAPGICRCWAGFIPIC